MSIEVKLTNLDGLSRALEKRISKMPSKLKEQLDLEANQIIARTQSGVDSSGSSFRPYRASTIRNRQEAGLQTQYVDLTFTGDMLKSIRTKVQSSGTTITGIIYFINGESYKVTSNLKWGRKFFALDRKQAENIRNKLRSP